MSTILWVGLVELLLLMAATPRPLRLERVMATATEPISRVGPSRKLARAPVTRCAAADWSGLSRWDRQGERALGPQGSATLTLNFRPDGKGCAAELSVDGYSVGKYDVTFTDSPDVELVLTCTRVEAAPWPASSPWASRMLASMCGCLAGPQSSVP
jgi:hypothetical protein